LTVNLPLTAVIVEAVGRCGRDDCKTTGADRPDVWITSAVICSWLYDVMMTGAVHGVKRYGDNLHCYYYFEVLRWACPSVRLSVRSHIAKRHVQTSPNFVHVAGVRFTCDDNAIRYVLLGFRMTVIFAIMGHDAWLMGV